MSHSIGPWPVVIFGQPIEFICRLLSTVLAFWLTVIPAWTLISPTLRSISLGHLMHASDVYRHLLDHGQRRPIC